MDERERASSLDRERSRSPRGKGNQKRQDPVGKGKHDVDYYVNRYGSVQIYWDSIAVKVNGFIDDTIREIVTATGSFDAGDAPRLKNLCNSAIDGTRANLDAAERGEPGGHFGGASYAHEQ